MNKFKIGEKAIFTPCISRQYTQMRSYLTEVLEDKTDYADYIIRTPHGSGMGCFESELRKLPGDDKKDYIPPNVRKLFTPVQKPVKA